MRDKMDPVVISYGQEFNGCENLHKLTRDDLIRRVRQLNVLVLSSGTRISTLSEDIREIQALRQIENNELYAERELLQMEVADLKKTIALLECAVRTKQDCIDCCDAEIAGLRSVIHYIQTESEATGVRIGFLMQQNQINPDGSGC